MHAAPTLTNLPSDDMIVKEILYVLMSVHKRLSLTRKARVKQIEALKIDSVTSDYRRIDPYIYEQETLPMPVLIGHSGRSTPGRGHPLLEDLWHNQSM